MLIGETIRVALDALRVNTMRSLLTMLGIVIGVGAVIAVVALGNGAENSVKDRIARLGTTVLQINPQRVQQGGVGFATTAKLTMKDVDMIREKLRIGGRQFTVIGVMAPKGATGFGDADSQILIPFNTGRFGTFGTDRLNDIWALAASDDSVTAAMGEITLALRRSHKLVGGRPDDFMVRNQADMLVILNETTQTFAMLLAGIAAVSLLVGGIGIMNIMLVSVTERTREIGVRKALGATRVNIMLQFLTESVVLCLLGGILGIAAGLGAAAVMHSTMGWDTAVDAKSIAVAFAFASSVGLVFGVWPAKRAASLDPIVALRYE